MSRARIIKPDFFQSRSLARVSRDARLTFIGLWTEADAEGRGIAHPAILRGRIWPLDVDITDAVVVSHLYELASTGHITVYESDGDAFFAVVSWHKHQSAAYRTGESKLPAPESCRVVSPDEFDPRSPGVIPGVVQVAQPVMQLATPVVQVAQEVVPEVKGSERKGLRSEPAVQTARRVVQERPANPMWDVLSECFVEPATKTERSNRGRIMRELTEAGATPDEVRKRVNEHARRRLHWDLTENALVTHWAELAPRRNDGDDISSVLGYRFTGSM